MKGVEPGLSGVQRVQRSDSHVEPHSRAWTSSVPWGRLDSWSVGQWAEASAPSTCFAVPGEG